MYTINPAAMASVVPQGIDFLGSFRSPDIATPAVKPVTAGKKMPNKVEKLTPLGDTSEKSKPFPSEVPKNMEINERAMAPKMKYCVLMAILVLIKAIVTIRSKASDPTIRRWLMVISSIPNGPFKTNNALSLKPIKYREILMAVATKIVRPIAPPIGNPKLLDNI